MTAGTSIAKQAVHDKLEAQIRSAEARLETLKARAEAAKANVEIKAIADLLPRRQVIHRKLQHLKKADGHTWDQAKSDIETHIANLENSMKGIESRVRSS